MPRKTLRNAWTALALLALVGLLLPSQTLARGRHDVRLHVEIYNPRTGDEKMNLDMPMSALDSILEIIENEIEAEWDRNTRHHGVDLRELYRSLRDEDLSDFLEVQGHDGHLKVWKDREAFHVQAWEEEGSDPKVRIYIPLEVLDALFGGRKDELDLRAALEVLRDLAPLDLVTVDEENESVRIWLD